MAKVDLAVLEAEEKKQKAREDDVPSKLVNGKRYFQGITSNDWFDSLGEALNERQNQRSAAENKKVGLNEYGQSKEDIEKGAKIKVLIEERNKLIDQIRKVECQIGAVNNPIVMEESQKKKK